MGDASAERQVSLSNGRAGATALRGNSYEVVGPDSGPDLGERLRDFSPDTVIGDCRLVEGAACHR